MPMVHSSRRKNVSFMLALVAVGLLLAIALPSATLATSHPTPPPVGTELPPPPPPAAADDDERRAAAGADAGAAVRRRPDNGMMQPTPTPDNGMMQPTPTPGNGMMQPTPTPGTDMDMDNGTMDTSVSIPSNSIVTHAATPAQLVKSGGGLQYYYIGADGSSVTGPTLPSFSDLAEMYPSGDWVPLLDAPNPLTGKHVNVDYIPNEAEDSGSAPTTRITSTTPISPISSPSMQIIRCHIRLGSFRMGRVQTAFD